MSPNFFLVGAPKAGTTSLYEYLGQHPQVYLCPIKEPCYFSDEIRPKNFHPELRPLLEREMLEVEEYVTGPMTDRRFSGIVASPDDYAKLFAGVRQETAIGEGSVHYLWSPSAPRNIAERFPRARILMLLRDPAERAFSQYLHGVTAGRITWTFRTHLERGRAHGPLFDLYNPFLEFGMYSGQVARYREHFPREQIFIGLYEDYRDRAEETLRRIFRFLEVNPEVPIDLSQRQFEPRVPKHIRLGRALKKMGVWQTGKWMLPKGARAAVKSAVLRPRRELAMAPQDRAQLIEYYAEDIGRLADLIGRDLTGWMR